MAYRTVTQLRDEILAKCQDSSFITSIIVNYLNDAMANISERAYLPALDTASMVTTDTAQNSIALPSDFHRNLYGCHSDTHNSWVPVYDSLGDLERRLTVLDQAGRVIGVSITSGSYLYYQRLPSTAETMTLYYLAKPATINSSSTPSEIPEGFSRGLLVNFCLHQIFMVKAIRDPKFIELADKYGSLYESDLSDLILKHGNEHKIPYKPQDDMNLDLYL